MAALSTRRARFAGGSAIVEKPQSVLGVAPYEMVAVCSGLNEGILARGSKLSSVQAEQ
jgi:hypothetical protein